jgi:hypothetical protein
MMLVWLAGVTILTLRLFTGWIWVQRLRTHGVYAVQPAWERILVRLSRQLHISRTITLLESTRVDVPTVIGWLKPVVLMPMSALGALSPAQLEAILAHELAHIRRHDYLVNLLQTLVETLLFYHPAVWWVSRRIRIERENCCDDLAVSLCGDPVAYANALADLESLRSSIPPLGRLDRMAMAATGGSLLQRVRRLLGAPTSHTGRGPAWLAASVALLVVAGITLGADGVLTVLTVRVSGQALTPAPVTQVDPRPVVAATAPSTVAPAAAVATTVTAATPQGVTPEDPRPQLAQAASPAAQSSSAETTRARAHPRDTQGAVARVAESIARIASAEPVGASSEQSVRSHSSSDSHGNWIWSNNGEKLQVEYSGTFDFNDQDDDVQQISPGGWLKISDGAWLGRHSVELSERGGRIERRYFVNGLERPYEPQGHEWLRQNLPRFVRNTGLGAPARVSRFLKSGGVPAVITEIARIEGNYVKGIYYRELFKQATLTPEQYRQVMAQASHEMSGANYELAQLLIAVADRLPNDEASRAAYFSAAANLSSAYETRRVYSAMIKKGPVPPQVLGGILTHAARLNSDYDKAELLREILAQQPLDDRNRAAFFAVVANMHGDYERHRVLSAVIRADGPSSSALVEDVLAQAEKMTNDHDTSTLLQEVLNQNSIEGPARAAFFRAVGGIRGSYERGRVLQAVVRKPDASRETMKAAMQASRGMNSYEVSQVLLAIAHGHELTGDLRDVYVEAADHLSRYEQDQVLSALVRSERRK